MNNDQKAELYHSYLLRHDRLDSQIADIKSEAAGRDLNKEQQDKINLIESQKSEIVAETQKLFENY
jgi:hypothetical protein|tara:strand:+ start:1380 stop:1577 length:198 start_codon:yes stop_codon:yes gene_type:complete